ncbi:hypothetical protein [Pseudomonas sp. PDM27]|uniref:hypothetical protein n=1 Tax=Pseudomonas sp. PDM27 TaxID=2854769 RepID=UPI001C474915|nr:hypothetical protein [Pseudomonas sp. PDM27]MBV7570661.1 hypothetical protein [Pseudomonas sp. PDM27]
MTDELKAVAVASSPWEQATLLINGKKVEGGAEPVLLRGRGNVVTVEAPPAIARELNLALPVDGGLNIVASPDFNKWVSPVNGKFTWTITPDAGKSGRITLVFFSREVTELWGHRSLVISSSLADEVDVKVDDKDVSHADTAFLRTNRRNIKLLAKPNSPVAGLAFIMRYEILDKLLPGAVESVPAIGDETFNLEWDVGCVAAGSGFLRLEFYCQKLDSSIYLECKQVDVRYSVAGKEIEIIDGVGQVEIQSWGYNVFLIHASPEMFGDTVEVEGGGMLIVEPKLPFKYIVDPGTVVKRMNVAKNMHSGTYGVMFKLSNVGDYIDVVNISVK